MLSAISHISFVDIYPKGQFNANSLNLFMYGDSLIAIGFFKFANIYSICISSQYKPPFGTTICVLFARFISLNYTLYFVFWEFPKVNTIAFSHVKYPKFGQYIVANFIAEFIIGLSVLYSEYKVDNAVALTLYKPSNISFVSLNKFSFSIYIFFTFTNNGNNISDVILVFIYPIDILLVLFELNVLILYFKVGFIKASYIVESFSAI